MAQVKSGFFDGLGSVFVSGIDRYIDNELNQPTQVKSPETYHTGDSTNPAVPVGQSYTQVLADNKNMLVLGGIGLALVAVVLIAKA